MSFKSKRKTIFLSYFLINSVFYRLFTPIILVTNVSIIWIMIMCLNCFRDLEWNYTMFVVNRQGNVEKRFTPKDSIKVIWFKRRSYRVLQNICISNRNYNIYFTVHIYIYNCFQMSLGTISTEWLGVVGIIIRIILITVIYYKFTKAYI